MTMLAGAIAFDSHISVRDKASQIASSMTKYSHLQNQLIVDENGICVIAIYRDDQKLSIPSVEISEQKRIWIIGDIYSSTNENKSPSVSDVLQKLIINSPPGRWIALEVNSATGKVRIATDRLGLLWLYIAKTEYGYIFSNDFSAIAENLDSTPTINEDVLLLELALGYTPDDSTIFKDISIAPAGTIVELDPKSLKNELTRKIQYGDKFASYSTEEKYETLDQIYQQIYSQLLKPLEREVVLSLSAGYDSRYILAHLQKKKVQVPLCTFGNENSDEVKGALSVASQVGQLTDIFSFEIGDWKQWSRCISQLGNTGMVQWSGWAEDWLSFCAYHGSAVPIGFLGDALSGKHLGANAEPSNGWVQHWIDWSTASHWLHSNLLLPSARKRMEIVVKESIYAMERKAIYAFDYQKALHFDLYGRQRRWVASQPNLISRFLDPVLFFYDNALIEFWTNLPQEDLLNQKLYLSYASKRFPQLFSKNEGKPPTLTSRIFSKISGSLDAMIASKARVKNPVIDHNMIIAPNRDYIIDLANKVKPYLSATVNIDEFIMEVKKYGQSSNVTSYEILKAVNLFHLLNLKYKFDNKD